MKNYILAFILKVAIVLFIASSLLLLDFKIITRKQSLQDAALLSYSQKQTQEQSANYPSTPLLADKSLNNSSNKFSSEEVSTSKSIKKLSGEESSSINNPVDEGKKPKNRKKDIKDSKKESVRDKLHSLLFNAHTLVLIKTGPYSKLLSRHNEDMDLRNQEVSSIIKNANFSGMNAKAKIGAGVEQYISGNTLGVLYSPYISVSKGNNVISVGPVIQKRTMLVTGIKAGFSRVITGNNTSKYDCDGDYVDQRLQVNFFGYIQYVQQMSLSYRGVQFEETMNKQLDYDWNKLKLNTAEMCMGIELHIRLTKNISWKNYFGISVYDHLNYKQEMYHDKISPTLLLGTGINISSFKR